MKIGTGESSIGLALIHQSRFRTATISFDSVNTDYVVTLARVSAVKARIAMSIAVPEPGKFVKIRSRVGFTTG